MGRLNDLTGKKFGAWTVVKRVENKQLGSPRTFWLCRCECGREKEIYANSLLSGKSKACGRHPKSTRPFGHADRHVIFWKYSENAKAKGLVFDITEDDFDSISQKPCFYCGDLPKPRERKHSRGNGLFIYNGLDRIDNNKGYTKDNIVPCCKDCNMAKKDMKQEFFISLAKKIARKHGG